MKQPTGQEENTMKNAEMTINEMQNYLLKHTDHKLVNELLASGITWNDAIVMAYTVATATH